MRRGKNRDRLRQPISSPCVSICRIDTHTYKCIGCGRTMEEIREWSIYTEEQRLTIMNRLQNDRNMGEA